MLNSLWLLLVVPGLPLLGFIGWLHWFVAQRDRASRRPFHEMPRPPGWSLQNRMSDLMSDFTWQFMCGSLIGIVAWALAFSEKIPAWLALGLGFPVCLFFIVRAGRSLLRYMNHRLGLLGEQVVGQTLDRLSSDSVLVIHDLEIREPGRKPWNIDHVVIARSGVFSIETKARRKPHGKRTAGQQGHKLIFDGTRIIFPAPMKPDRHGLDQAKRNADWLEALLAAHNGERVPVTPVLVFPGWWVEAKGKGAVAVMNQKQLPGFLAGRPAVLDDLRFRAISNQLTERGRIDLSLPV